MISLLALTAIFWHARTYIRVPHNVTSDSLHLQYIPSGVIVRTLTLRCIARYIYIYIYIYVCVCVYTHTYTLAVYKQEAVKEDIVFNSRGDKDISIL